MHATTAEASTSSARRWPASFLADAAGVMGERQKTLVAHARKAQQEQRLEAAVRLAATAFPDLKVPAAELDADPWALNTLSGLVDLRSGAVRPTTPADRVTMLAPVVYDPGARHARFDRFLEEVLPSPEVRAYVRRAVGYSISGSTREHAIFIPTGPGRNGKGVLMRLAQRARRLRAHRCGGVPAGPRGRRGPPDRARGAGRCALRLRVRSAPASALE
jgi:putative DNA primase/helicase